MQAQTQAQARAGAEATPRHLMSRKNESVAWRAFVKLGGNKVVCRICGKQMNYQSGSSTSNMVKHLQAVHKHILADAPLPGRYTKHITAAVEMDEPTNISNSEQWVVLQHAPAHLRQRWQDLKLGLQKEMQHHQQAVAWSAIGAPCLGAPAGADLLTDSHATSPCWGNNPASKSNTNNNNCNSSNTGQAMDSSSSESGDWRHEENVQACESDASYQYRVKSEPTETEDLSKRCESSSPPPQVLSPPPPPPPPPPPSISPAQCCSPIVLSVSTPGGNGMPPPSEDHDGPPPPKNKKHCASQTNPPIPCSELILTQAELDLRLKEIRRAQERAEEIHHELLRESRARADAAQAERDHRLQLIRHAEEIHQQALEAQRQAIEHNRQLHEITLRQAHKTCE